MTKLPSPYESDCITHWNETEFEDPVFNYTYNVMEKAERGKFCLFILPFFIYSIRDASGIAIRLRLSQIVVAFILTVAKENPMELMEVVPAM